MKTNPCHTCGLPVCAICKGHRFPANEAGIALSDKKHGEKKQPCFCVGQREKRAYGSRLG